MSQETPQNAPQGHSDPHAAFNEAPPYEAPQPQRPQRRENPADAKKALMEERKQAYLAKLRGDLNVPEAPKKANDAQEGPNGDSSESPGGEKAPKHPPSGDVVTPDYMQRVLDERSAAEKALAEAKSEREAASKAKAEFDAEEKRKRQLAKTDPMQWLAEDDSFTEEDWKEMLANGGELTAERKFKREVEKRMASQDAEMQKLRAELAQRDQAAKDAAENATITAGLKDYPTVAKLGGAPTVRQRQQQMAQQLGREVTWDQAATVMEQEYIHQLSQVLQDENIAAKLPNRRSSNGNKPRKSEPAATPTTLGRETAPSTPAQPTYNPKDWKAKKERFMALMKAQQS